MQTTYFSFLSAILNSFGTNVANLFKGKIDINGDFANYHQIFLSYQGGFGVGGWIFYVLMILLAVGIVGSILALLIYAIRRLMLRPKTKKGQEEKMRKEIERLNLELYDAIREKDKILGIKSSERAGLTPGASTESGEETDLSNARFPRLLQVDQKYPEGVTVTALPDDAKDIDLPGICERFRNFACSQMRLYYTIDTVRQFFASMGSGKLIILEGISGTGKTSLPYCMGRFFKNGANICSVQPSWRDRSELLGYYNEFTHKFTETEFLRAIYEATYRDDPIFIVLDEMNLARVEYYFAEFLSIMEMPNTAEWIINLISEPREDDPKHFQNGQLLIGQNIYFVGTANNDDSTFTITDKVYDRAMSLFFDNKGFAFEAPFTDPLPMPYSYLESLFEAARKDHPISEETLEKFQQLDDYVIEHFKLAFGNRIMKQIQRFVPCYVGCGGTELEGLDYVFKVKILKKFEVLNVGFLKDELDGLLEELDRLFGPNEFLLSRGKIAALKKMSK